MHTLQFLIPLGWVETVGPILPIAILTLTAANIVTRLLSYRSYKQQAADGAEELDRHGPHLFTSTGLVVLTLLFILYRPTSGMIMMVPVFGLFITDFFEFESREVEARNDMEIERPKAGIAISAVVLLYAAYYGFQFLYQPYVELILA